MSKALPTKEIEFWLLGWNHSHNRGSTVTFQITDEDREYFENATVREGKVAGQRYAGVLVQLTDDDQPDPASVQEPKAEEKGATPLQAMAAFAAAVGAKSERVPTKSHFPTGLCGLAVKWCAEEHFQEWVAFTFPDDWADSSETVHSKMAADVIYRVCGVGSRKQLDDVPSAGEKFRARFMVPYMQVRKLDGVDGG